MNNVEEKNLKLIKLSKDVLFLSRNTLLVNMRFLDMDVTNTLNTIKNCYSMIDKNRSYKN